MEFLSTVVEPGTALDWSLPIGAFQPGRHSQIIYTKTYFFRKLWTFRLKCAKFMLNILADR
ncbi:MAG: hypothetical protein CO150_10345 [Nitrospirae bacterium CG_4_9_14_3_um_filter_53_35]|nr:MAG: hypothetical protein AUK29_10015 [Nitrospirae bacterium CG2_30_53_67]PIS36304.1 MAG: hypothetical protein COT35_11865 [Nitrospirae bacterium CG08_land_8_20_14_0_20_52_24]PIV85430.1 MAG: hypothetical protein COW52_02280 [Nitrospirae bacterium CG17_big_fil_post_rev_8_21_14_2_50_50_9]PIW85066.1 MAG: hypothetical protein COZ95_06540 [Nitrospirae bacterium CG_4_8_14_3_um_filter_50_41]PIX86000.1 MAG: hypothetical protein COZ32_05550 [Nitrospirae bacterium CG_4_10_14_3_um_filter_53_41]PJA7277